MKCTICNKPIVLVPSASERAKRYGSTASDYANMFTTHSQCSIDQYKADVSKLMASKRLESTYLVLERM